MRADVPVQSKNQEMASIHARLDLLRRLRRPLREAALTRAIAHATPEEADALVAEMIDQARDSRGQALLGQAIARWPRLSLDARRALAAAAGDRLGSILASLASDPTPESRRAPIEILADLADSRVPAPAQDPDSALGALAALTDEDLTDPPTVEALARVVQDLSHEASPLGSEIDRTLASAARSYAIHRSGALMDAVLTRAAHAGPCLREWLEDHTEPGHLALRGAVRRLSREDAARRVVPLMGVRAIAGACVERLEKLEAPELLARVMLDAPLLESRHRRAALRRLRRPEKVLPDPSVLPTLPARARLGYIRWVNALPLRAERRLELLGAAAPDADPRVRLMCVRAIAALAPSPALDEALAQCAADADPRVATPAASALAGARSESRRATIAALIAPLVHSPHAGVRSIVERLVGPGSLNTPGARRRWFHATEVRRALLRSRDETLADLRAQIISPDRDARLAALTIATRLALVGVVREQVVGAARSADPYVAAKAARALATLREPGARQELTRLVEHKDMRVRADAIESLGALGAIGESESIDLARLAEHPTARVRANTLRAMLRTPAHTIRARAGLAEMLADTRPDHRRSALWVVQRSAVTSLADRVAEIVRFDPDEAVRVRARLCGKRLLAEMRRAWTERAPGAPIGSLSQGAAS